LLVLLIEVPDLFVARISGLALFGCKHSPAALSVQAGSSAGFGRNDLPRKLSLQNSAHAIGLDITRELDGELHAES
jgi:hypothetical protein